MRRTIAALPRKRPTAWIAIAAGLALVGAACTTSSPGYGAQQLEETD